MTKQKTVAQVPVSWLKTCMNCEKSFNSTREGKKFCGKKCTQKYHNSLRKTIGGYTKNCQWCGEEFKTSRKDSQYCSPSHRGMARRSENILVYFTEICSHRKKRESLSGEDLLEIWNEQKGKCALTGLEMTWLLGQGRVPTNVSVDRIDAGGPYIKENIQLVCGVINKFRGDLTIPEFKWWCRKVIENADN